MKKALIIPAVSLLSNSVSAYQDQFTVTDAFSWLVKTLGFILADLSNSWYYIIIVTLILVIFVLMVTLPFLIYKKLAGVLF